MGDASTVDPKIVIIIPVFKHSVFVTEAIESAIGQVAPYDIATVVVDDGCPFSETTAVAASYALERRDVFFLRKPNGGLSSARNFGIDFALARFPKLEAVYLLDADNRITPNAMATAFRHPEPASRCRLGLPQHRQVRRTMERQFYRALFATVACHFRQYLRGRQPDFTSHARRRVPF